MAHAKSSDPATLPKFETCTCTIFINKKVGNFFVEDVAALLLQQSCIYRLLTNFYFGASNDKYLFLPSLKCLEYLCNISASNNYQAYLCLRTSSDISNTGIQKIKHTALALKEILKICFLKSAKNWLSRIQIYSFYSSNYMASSAITD